MKKKLAIEKREERTYRENEYVCDNSERRTMNGTEADEDEVLREPAVPLVNLGLIRLVLHILLRRNEVMFPNYGSSEGCKSLTHRQSHKLIVSQFHGVGVTITPPNHILC